MVYHLDDTIVAIASPPGNAARAIIRISGPDVLACVDRLFRSAASDCPFHASSLAIHPSFFNHPAAVAGHLHLPGLYSPLPADLYYWPVGRSYTGQAVAEFHMLGSPPLADAVLRAATDAGARLAGPGEFTLRAFLAGRIDLTQAEAVLGVIDATDDERLAVALEQLSGGLSRPLAELRATLLSLAAHLEAGFDFPEDDVSFITPKELDERLGAAHRAAAALKAQLQSRDRTGQRPRVVLIGRPNAGKSSLFNALIGKAGAMVSHHPGTTRDYVSAEVELAGVRFQLIDTAGIGRSDDAHHSTSGQITGAAEDQLIGQAAEEVAFQQIAQADVRIHCVDATEKHIDRVGNSFLIGWRGHNEAVAKSLQSVDLLVFTKADLIRPRDGLTPFNQQWSELVVSSVTGQGLDVLRTRLLNAVLRSQSTPDHAVASTAARCGQSLRRAVEAIDRARRLAASGDGEELVAAEIRVALEAIGRVAGTVCTDDVLEQVFSRFCIGK